MKAKLVNGNIEIINDIQYKKDVYDAYQQSINREGVTDVVFSLLKSKDNKTEDELRLVLIRESLDAQYNNSISKYDNYKDYVEVEYSGTEPTDIDILMPYFEQTETTIYRKMKVVKNDPYKVRKKIEKIQKDLSDSDYKIAKLYEAQVLGEDAPYDATEIISQRQEWRKQINELQKLLES